MAYAQSDGGSDWRKWKVLDVETGEDTGDLIDYTKFTSISWMPDNSGFFYSRYPRARDDPTRGDGSKAVSVYFHALGADQAEDRLVFSQPEHPRRNPYASVSEDGAYLLVNLQEGYLENAVHYRQIDEPDSAIRPLLDQWDALYGYIVNVGSVFLFETNKGRAAQPDRRGRRGRGRRRPAPRRSTRFSPNPTTRSPTRRRSAAG